MSLIDGPEVTLCGWQDIERQLLSTNNSKLGRSSFATASIAVCMWPTGRDSLILIIIDRFYIALFEQWLRSFYSA